MSAIIPVFIPHLGCPHKCVFCDQVKIAGTTAPSPDSVREQIESALGIAEKPELAFYGGSFTAIDRRLMEEYLCVARSFWEKRLISSVRVSTRPDAISDDILSRLEQSGVRTVEIGAQSFSDEVLRLSKRGHTEKDIYDASELIMKSGFRLVVQLMAGLPGSSFKQDVLSAEKTASISPWGARIYPVCVVTGTELYDMMLDGRYEPLSVDEGAERASFMLETLENAGVNVIRVGLNPTEELSSGGVVAGAYHPALGQIARSLKYLRKAARLIEGANAKSGTLTCRKGCLSYLRGQKNTNVKKLGELFPDTDISFEEAEQAEDVRFHAE